MCIYCQDQGLIRAKSKLNDTSNYVFRCACLKGKPDPAMEKWYGANKYSGVPQWEKFLEKKYIPEWDWGGDEDEFWSTVRALPNNPIPGAVDSFFKGMVENSAIHRAIKHKYRDKDLKQIYKEWQEWSNSVKIEPVRDDNEDGHTDNNIPDGVCKT